MSRYTDLKLEVKRLRIELKKFNAVRPSRKSILKRDNYTCRLCGDKEEELFCHHLTPKANNGTDDVSNYITICESCHWFMHCNPKLIMRRKLLHRDATINGLKDAVTNGKTLGRPFGKKDTSPRKKDGYFLRIYEERTPRKKAEFYKNDGVNTKGILVPRSLYDL